MKAIKSLLLLLIGLFVVAPVFSATLSVVGPRNAAIEQFVAITGKTPKAENIIDIGKGQVQITEKLPMIKK